MEWMKDYTEFEPGHRHISQLYCIYPGEQVTFEETPELMEAAKTTLMRRLEHGGGHTGWSRAWIINLWARFRSGEDAYQNYLALLRQSTFPNLMDNHPYFNEDGAAFQIDGNFGAVSGVLQFFVQDYNNHVILLPALPEAFSTGSLEGYRLKGNAELSMKWTEGKIDSLSISAYDDYKALLHYHNFSKEIYVEKGQIGFLTPETFVAKAARRFYTVLPFQG